MDNRANASLYNKYWRFVPLLEGNAYKSEGTGRQFGRFIFF